MNILSGDPPRGRALQALIVLIVLALALAPFLFPGAKALNTAAKTCVMILLVASYDVLLGYAGIVSFAHVMVFGVGAYGVGLALYALGPELGRAPPRARRRLCPVARAGAGDRPLFAARAVDLLRHGDARRRLRLQRARVPALLADGRGGRALVQGSGRPAAWVQMARSSDPRRAGERQAPRLLSRVRRRRRRFSRASQGGQLAVRTGVAGDQGEPVPRRGAGLPHRVPPHARDLHFGARRDAGRGVQRALAALCGAGHRALLLDPGRRPGHGRGRRHGLALRRDRRSGLVRPRRGLSAGRDGGPLASRRRRAAAAPAGAPPS